mmetsp:Transcript_106632/g.244123  ORF Transcript_106632/g.244123 Transcript_106632/m.244123 type:complete len:249 (+) Transcript_106632:1822-2568(+)
MEGGEQGEAPATAFEEFAEVALGMVVEDWLDGEDQLHCGEVVHIVGRDEKSGYAFGFFLDEEDGFWFPMSVVKVGGTTFGELVEAQGYDFPVDETAARRSDWQPPAAREIGGWDCDQSEDVGWNCSCGASCAPSDKFCMHCGHEQPAVEIFTELRDPVNFQTESGICTTDPIVQPHGGEVCEVPGISRLLEAAKLSKYMAAVSSWCDEMGAAEMDEVLECLDDLAASIGMKPLEIKRLRKVAAEFGSQ